VTLGLVIALWVVPSLAQTPPAAGRTSPSAATFSTLYDTIFAPVGCAAAFCHGANAPAGALQLGSRDRAYEALVGVPAAGTACADRGLLRVAPGEPQASLLLLKLTTQPPCGLAMPAPDALLSDSQVAAIRRWIEVGALDN
jgi:hypothetical protein